jgi:hypothetical protein
MGIKMTNSAKKGSRPRGRAPQSMLRKLGDCLAHCKSQVVRKFGSLRTWLHAEGGATADTSQLSGHTLRDTRTEAAFERSAKFRRTPSQDLRLSDVPGANATMRKKLAKHRIYTVVQLLGVYYTFYGDEAQFRKKLQNMCKVKSETTQRMLDAIREKANSIRVNAFPDMSNRKLQQLGHRLLRQTRTPCRTVKRVGEM